MRKQLYNEDNELKYNIINIAFFVFFSAAFLWIFLGQYYRGFPSDLLYHISYGGSLSSSYSLMYIILAALDALPLGGLFIAMLLTLFIWFSVYVTKLLLSFLVKTLCDGEAWVWAWVCHMVYPLLFMTPNPYRGVFNCNIYHNSTYLGMKPFALLSILFFFKVISSYKDKSITVKEWLCLAGSLVAATLFKPNFTVGFVLAVLCVLLWDFIRAPKKKFMNYFLVGVTLLPSGLLILYQQSLALNTDSSVAVGLFKAFYAGAKFPITGLIVSVAFPLLCLIFVFADLFKDRFFCFVWVNFLINFAIASLLYETGYKMKDGNFVWGLCFSIGVLFVISIYKFLELKKENQTNKLIVLSMFLGMHIFSWFKYIYELLNGRLPW